MNPTNKQIRLHKIAKGSPKKLNITLPSKTKSKITTIKLSKKGENCFETPNKRKFEVYSSSSTKGKKSQNNSAEKSKRTATN